MLIGRDKELADLEVAHVQRRLVTIWGPGGIGKSCLARELASRQRAGGADVFSIGLRDIAQSVEGLVAALARELEIETPNPPLSAVAQALEARQRPLLQVDEGECAPEALGRLLKELLGRTAHVRFLVTTRSLLGIAEEFPYELAPLPTRANDGAASSAAGELFLLRARTLVPHFEIGEPALSTVLASTEGVPLAIELMAADCATLPEGTLLRHMPASLDATIERSWDRLSPTECEGLTKLAAFSGTFSGQAASAVLGPVNAVQLSSLRRQSLVLIDRDIDPAPRFRVLTAVRSFVRMRATPVLWQKAISAHANYFAEFAKATSTDRGLVEELLCVAERAVTDASLLPFAADVLDALLDRMTVDVFMVKTLLDDILRAHATSPWVPRFLAARALASEAIGDLVSAAKYIAEAERVAAERCASLDPYVSLAGCAIAHALSDATGARKAIHSLLSEQTPARIRGRAFLLQSAVESVEGNLSAALAAIEAALACSREACDERAVHRARLWLAFILLDAGQPERALSELSVFTTSNATKWQRALALTYRGNTLRRLGDLVGARESHAESVSLFRKVISRRWESTAVMHAAITELVAYEIAQAIVLFEEALSVAESVADAHLIELISGYLSIALLFSGERARARELLARAAKDAATATSARATAIHLAHLRYVDGEISRADLEQVVLLQGPSAASPTEHTRFAAAFAERSIERLDPPSVALVVTADRVRVPRTRESEATWVDLSRRPTHARLLRALAKVHPRALTVLELLAVGWPEEGLQASAGANRLRVALSALRSLNGGALRHLLVYDERGYRLEQNLRVIVDV